MSSPAVDSQPSAHTLGSGDLGESLRRLGREGARLASHKLGVWQRQVKDEVPPGSVIDRAVVAALRTGLPGPGKGNPAKAALGTIWAGTGVAGRAALVGLLLLLVATAPVLLLVALLLVALVALALRTLKRK